MHHVRAVQSAQNISLAQWRADFSGFDSPSPPRTNHKHREEAQEMLNQAPSGDQASLEQ